MTFAFIHANVGCFPLLVMCAVLEVSRSGYYAWRKQEAGARAKRRAELAAKVKAVFEQSRGRYGSPRVFQVLRSQGETCTEKTVARIMRQLGLAAKTGKRFVPRTTDSAHDRPVAPNLLGRAFQQDKPDRAWVCDITYIPTGEGWLYLAGVLDLCSRKMVGWSMAQHMEASLVMAALESAIDRRQPAPGLLVHSDRGSQYASDDYQGLLGRHKLLCSMSGKGDCYDNAVMESCWASLKRELADGHVYATRDQARAAIFEYIEVFYNRVRLHSTLGYVSPETFEARLAG